ncbi:MAG: xanthine dehydrogenase accessory protein XdhC, partial [Pseudomonadota bacterium]
WCQTMKDWLAALETQVEAGGPATLVTIADAKGSSPREAGVKMLVTEEASAGTVGGGNLEHEAIRIARDMLKDRQSAPELRRFALGPSLGQCCGGDTQLLFEVAAPHADFLEPLRAFADAETPSVLATPIDAVGTGKTLVTAERVVGAAPSHGLVEAARALLDKPGNAGARLWNGRSPAGGAATYLLEQTPGRNGHVLLIGAGHVGKAIATTLGPLPFAVTWADNRPEQYPDEIPANVTPCCTPHLERAIDEAPAGTIYLVMTYSHDLDYALCARVLERGDFRYLGLIGSKTKRARFEKTMRDLGLPQTAIDRVVCPIGLPGIESKQPTVIAVAVAAQILGLPADNGQER